MNSTQRVCLFLSITVATLTMEYSVAQAQCNCDHTIGLSTTTWNGRMNNLQPGQTVCVTAGTREYLRLYEIVGTANAPVVVQNCGGLVRITNPTRAYALTVEQSRYFRLTGTGDASIPYGFHASAPATSPYPGVGLWLLGQSTNYEADHIEVSNTGFAGVMAKTDPSTNECDPTVRAVYESFVQRDVRLHHLFVHDVGGEGFYVGSTQYPAYRVTCNGATVMIPPHRLEGIEVSDNIIENTGWDGMQVGIAPQRCVVARNQIRHVGLAGEMYQQQGIQIGSLSACEIYGNYVLDGPTNGLFVLTAGNVIAYNNVFAQVDTGIYFNTNNTTPGVSAQFYNNTLVYRSHGLRMFGPDSRDSRVFNNLSIGPGTGVEIARDVMHTAGTNAVYTSFSAAGTASDTDYHLTSNSPARSAGTDLRANGVTHDIDGRERPTMPSIGAYEYVDLSTLDAGTMADSSSQDVVRTDTSRTETGMIDEQTNSQQAGCGCRTVSTNRSRRQDNYQLYFLALGLAFLRKRRQHRNCQSFS